MRAVLRIILVVLAIQVAVTLIPFSILELNNNAPNKTLSMIFGSTFAWVNFALLALLWRMIFETSKKKVALVLVLIVIKYGILIGIFSNTSKITWLESMWFAVGIMANPISVIIGGLNYKLLMKNNSKEN